MTIFIKGRGGDLFTPATVDCVENDTPLGDVDRRVLEEVVEEYLG
jgi:hypothetical protein